MHTQETGRQITPSTGAASEALSGGVKHGRGAAPDPVLRRVGGGAVPPGVRTQAAAGRRVFAETRACVMPGAKAQSRPSQTLCRRLGHARGARCTLTTR